MKQNHIAILLWIGFFFVSESIFPAEIQFPSGDTFLVEVIEETPVSIKFTYRNIVYLVPRKDLAAYDPQAKGSDVAYRISKFVLVDGSNLQGVIVEENETVFILKSELGFLTIAKEKVAKGPNPAPGVPVIPSRYLSSSSAKFQSRLGASLTGMGSTAGTQALYGIAVYYEPDGIITPWSLKLGFRTEYIMSENTNIFNNFLYWRTFGSLWEWKIFFHLGVGPSFGSYDSEYKKISELNPAIFMEYGSDIYEWESGFIRTSIRNITVLERSGVVFLPGLEVSVGTFL
jgi:hypothetical protein